VNEMDEVKEILLSEIEWPDPLREEINDEDIERMKTSIMATGQIHAIVVQEVEPHKYHGVIGRLRFLGAQRAHVTTILARIHSFSDESEKTVWQLVENVVRRELNAMIKAEAIDKIKQNYEREIGEKLQSKHEVDFKAEIVESIRKEVEDLSGEEPPSRRTVWRYLEIAKVVPEDVKKLLRGVTSSTFGVGHADQLLRLKEDHDGMLKAAQFIIENNPTVAGLKTFIDDYATIRLCGTDQVKEAVEKKEISVRQGAVLAEATSETQDQILDMTKKGELKPAETKKIVDFAIRHEDRVPELLAAGKKDPEKAVAIAQGRDSIQDEGGQSFFRGNSLMEEYKIPCKCPQCLAGFNTKITVNWEKGELKY